MAKQGSLPHPGPSSSATVAKFPRPTSPDLQTDSDDDATSSDSDEDISSSNVRKSTGKEEPTARQDRAGDIRDDSQKPPPGNRNEDLVRAVQERIRVHSLLYDTPSTITTPKQKSTGPPISRAHLRLALSTLRARQFLASSSFSPLSSALNEISKALLSLGGPDALAKTMLGRRPAFDTTTAPTRGKPNFGVFIPVLARLVKDVRTTLSAEGVKGKEFRRSELSKEEAKALVALRQRWWVKPAGATGGKSIGRGGKRDQKDLDWVGMVEKLVAEVRSCESHHPLEPTTSGPRLRLTFLRVARNDSTHRPHPVSFPLPITLPSKKKETAKPLPSSPRSSNSSCPPPCLACPSPLSIWTTTTSLSGQLWREWKRSWGGI